MRKTDVIFLICVLGFAALVAARSISLSAPLLIGGTPPGSATFGVAGQSRGVDMTKLKPLLDRGELSDREAEFYGPVGPPADSGNGDAETDTPDAPRKH